jgi:hypothetical protein
LIGINHVSGIQSNLVIIVITFKICVTCTKQWKFFFGFAVNRQKTGSPYRIKIHVGRKALVTTTNAAFLRDGNEP